MIDAAKDTARTLRKNQTDSEKILWEILRNRKFLGLRFVRQHPIKVNYLNEDRFFVADFYCPRKKVIIEVDGDIHDFKKEYDELRTLILNQLNIDVIRIRNEDVHENLIFTLNNLERQLK